jgi:Family of unknown function (DUF6056)
MTHSIKRSIRQILLPCSVFAVLLYTLWPSLGTTPMLFDDYQFAYEHNKFGWLPQSLRLYQTWTGRLLMNVGSGPLTSLPTSYTRWAGTVSLVICVVTIPISLRLFSGRLQSEEGNDLRPSRQRSASISLSMTVGLLWLTGSPSWFQTTQWMSGQLVYLLPVCCTFVGAALCYNGWPSFDTVSRTKLAFGVVLLAVGSSGNELLAASIPSALIATFVVTRPRQRVQAFVVTLAVSLASITVFIAPGARARSQALPLDRSIEAIIGRVGNGLAVFSYVCFTTMALPLVAIMTMGYRLQDHLTLPDSVKRASLWATAIGATTAMSVYVVIPALTLGGAAPARALFPVWAWLATLAFFGGNALKDINSPATKELSPKPKNPDVALSVIGIMIASASFVITQHPKSLEQRIFYARWQCIDTAARSDSKADLRFSASEQFEGIYFLTGKANSWPNQWTARYYGKSSIMASADPAALCAS